MGFRRDLVCAVVFCLAASRFLMAQGVLMVEKTTIGDTPHIHQIQIEGNRMRIETGWTSPKPVMIFDGVADLFQILAVDKKSYTEIPRARSYFQRIGDSGGFFGVGARPPAVEYRRAGSDTVGNWLCENYEGFLGPKKVSEICTVEPRALGFGFHEFEPFQALLGLVGRGEATHPGMFLMGMSGEGDLTGLPVRFEKFVDPVAPQEVTEVTEVTRQTFPAPTFKVPAGYQKVVR